MFQVVPGSLGTVGTGILEGLASSGKVVPAVLGTVGTWILGGLVSGTCWDVSSCPEAIFGTGSVRCSPGPPWICCSVDWSVNIRSQRSLGFTP